MSSKFTHLDNVETPLGACDSIWATSEKHIGMRGTFRINGVNYDVRIDLTFWGNEWHLGEEDKHRPGFVDNSSRWNSLMISRAEWNWTKGRRPEPTSSAREKLSTLVPWLINWATTVQGRKMVAAAGRDKREKYISGLRQNIMTLTTELAEAERELNELLNA